VKKTITTEYHNIKEFMSSVSTLISSDVEYFWYVIVLYDILKMNYILYWELHITLMKNISSIRIHVHEYIHIYIFSGNKVISWMGSCYMYLWKILSKIQIFYNGREHFFFNERTNYHSHSGNKHSSLHANQFTTIVSIVCLTTRYLYCPIV
jgi:hypothetical protein